MKFDGVGEIDFLVLSLSGTQALRVILVRNPQIGKGYLTANSLLKEILS